MPHPSVTEFKEILLHTPLESVVENYIFGGVPFLFENDLPTLATLTTHLRDNLGVPESSITVVGSAQIGFSLNPENFPRQFSPSSDVDVAIVDEQMFDKLWMTLLRWNFPRRLKNLGKLEGDWMRLRRKDVYWGWFVPDEIRFDGLAFPDVLVPMRDVSTAWFNAFHSLSRHPELATRDIRGRLYRTRDHAMMYHLEGLRQLREKIRSGEGV